MPFLNCVTILLLGVGLVAMGAYMVRTGKSPTGVPPGQEEFQAMHATAFDALHRFLGTCFFCAGLALEFILFGGLVQMQ